MDLNTVFFIGKPGSGKGTQAKLLAEKTGWPTFSSGEMFRALAKEDTFAARKYTEEGNRGMLAPDWFAAYLFQKTVLNLSPEDGVIFDGFARKRLEAETVATVLDWLGRPFKAVHVKVSDEEIVTRLTKRGAVSGRADDGAIGKRLEEYRTFTEPCISFFRDTGNLVEVNGEGAVEDIHKEVVEKLNIK